MAILKTGKNRVFSQTVWKQRVDVNRGSTLGPVFGVFGNPPLSGHVFRDPKKGVFWGFQKWPVFGLFWQKWSKRAFWGVFGGRCLFWFILFHVSKWSKKGNPWQRPCFGTLFTRRPKNTHFPKRPHFPSKPVDHDIDAVFLFCTLISRIYLFARIYLLRVTLLLRVTNITPRVVHHHVIT